MKASPACMSNRDQQQYCTEVEEDGSTVLLTMLKCLLQLIENNDYKHGTDAFEALVLEVASGGDRAAMQEKRFQERPTQVSVKGAVAMLPEQGATPSSRGGLFSSLACQIPWAL